jgi:hypothetical protein
MSVTFVEPSVEGSSATENVDVSMIPLDRLGISLGRQAGFIIRDFQGNHAAHR